MHLHVHLNSLYITNSVYPVVWSLISQVLSWSSFFYLSFRPRLGFQLINTWSQTDDFGMHHNPKSTSLSQFSESSHARSSGSRSVQQVPSSLGTRPRQEGASISPVPSDKDVWETVDEGELKDLVEQYGKSGGRFFSLDYVGELPFFQSVMVSSTCTHSISVWRELLG